MDIPEIDIDIREIGIRDIPTWLKEPPQAIPPSVPVTQEVGVPIVNIPGCVEAHESNNKSNKIGIDDENGLVTYCCLLYTSPSPRDATLSRMPSSA